MQFPIKLSGNRTEAPAQKKLALVLSGGGPRGALQVGALRALMEENILPDLIIGTSIGAINGAFLARYGFNIETLDFIIDVWDSSARGDFAPEDFTRAMLRNLLPGVNNDSYLKQARVFYARHGITPELHFGDLIGPDFYIIAADISHHQLTIFGENPEDLVLDSMLASSAIPPWLPPLSINGSLYMDGGAVSDVPIEPAIRQGATELIVLDLFNPPSPTNTIHGAKALMDRIITTMEARHIELELELARLKGISIHHWRLASPVDLALWDLSQTHNLIHVGYEAGKEYLVEMQRQREVDAAKAREQQALIPAISWQTLWEQARTIFSNNHR